MIRSTTRRRFVLAALAVSTLAGSAGLVLRTDNVTSRPDGEILRLTPAALDFGKVRAPAAVSGSVSIANTSPQPVVIESVSSSCTCTASNFQGPVALAPGEAMVLDVELRLGEDDIGPIARSLTLTTGRETLDLPISAIATGQPRITLSPGIIDFGQVGAWEEASRTFTIRCGTPVTLRSTSFSLSDNRLQIVALPQSAFDTLTFRLTVPRDLPCGTFSGSGIVETNFGAVRFAFLGEKVGLVFSRSKIVAFRRDVGKSPGESTATVLLNHAPHIEIERASILSESADIRVRAITCVSSDLTRLTLVLFPGDSSDASSGEMNLSTNINPTDDPVQLRWLVTRAGPIQSPSPPVGN